MLKVHFFMTKISIQTVLFNLQSAKEKKRRKSSIKALNSPKNLTQI